MTENLAVLEPLPATDKNTGLSQEQAEQRLKADGPNELSKGTAINPWSLLFEQFKSSVVILLLVATVVSFAMKEYLQTAGILVALVINAAIGFLTEYRAKVSLNSLAKLAGATARVRRAGGDIELPVTELVYGDIVLLEAGNRAPADLSILESAAFSLDQSHLTGESVPVWKSAEAEDLEERMVYQGTSVLGGRAICVVVATGAKTKMGKLGLILQEVISGETPLTKSLDTLGQQLSLLVIVLCVVFGLIGILKNASLERMLETSIALAVAAIPEGLPVIATLALAAGIRRMVRSKALVRRLAAVETLGCTTVICTDKTGTLTENKMMVTDIVLDGLELKLSGHGYEPVGELTSNGQVCKIDELTKRVNEFLTAIAACNDAKLEHKASTSSSEGSEELWLVHGDPTEGALITAAMKLGLKHEQILEQFPRIAEVPFDLERKRMSTVHQHPERGDHILFLKGSPGVVLDLCSNIRTASGDIALEDDMRSWFRTRNQELAKRGLRVLAVASRYVESIPHKDQLETLEEKMVLLGLVAMSDRPKENVQAAIETCQKAGIRLVMLTGDQLETAKSIAKELGIFTSQNSDQQILIGSDLQKLTDEQFKETLKQVSVLARVTPEMKLDIVKRLQGAGHIVAMTGDGVNDAPALRQSNIGIAMGETGTDLAREASDLVITDDNFATIVKAVQQGRITYANISRAVGYLLTASLTSVVAIMLGLLANTGLFLEPLQLLYLNLIMHVFPGLGIVLQKGSSEVMKQQPRKQTEQLMDRYEQIQIVTRSALLGSIILAAVLYNQTYLDQANAATVALAALSFALIMQSWSWLSVRGYATDVAWYKNGPMLASTAINLALLAAALYIPPLQSVLNTASLSNAQLLLVVSAALATQVLSIPLKALGAKSVSN
ncbi:MAG: cation-translocating P-type ATPase [Candidatus Melainabacteria bacterium]|nr:cation-translocating P-type ATPase [Candidatus Melainabacteria bacterium]